MFPTINALGTPTSTANMSRRAAKGEYIETVRLPDEAGTVELARGAALRRLSGQLWLEFMKNHR